MQIYHQCLRRIEMQQFHVGKPSNFILVYFFTRQFYFTFLVKMEGVFVSFYLNKLSRLVYIVHVYNVYLNKTIRHLWLQPTDWVNKNYFTLSCK